VHLITRALYSIKRTLCSIKRALNSIKRALNSIVWALHSVKRALDYGLATVIRIDKVIGLFCRIVSLLQGSFAKETYDCIDPTNRSHPIEQKSPTFGGLVLYICMYIYMYLYIYSGLLV